MPKAIINADEVDEITIIYEGVPVTLAPWEWWDSYSRSTNGKVTPAQIMDIRERFHHDEESARVLAEEYGVTRRTVFRIVRGHSYAAVPMPRVRRPYSNPVYDR